MANVVEDRESIVTADDSAVLFSQEEVREIADLKHCGDDHVEVTCGCTSYCGDFVGTLRIFASGALEINCDCYRGCKEDKLTPAAFEKHSCKEGASRWKHNIWVIVAGQKVPLAKTALLKYYDQSLMRKRANRSGAGPVRHRDEFLRCTQCNKLRRFHLRTREDCRAYHDAFINNNNWKCSDMPHHNFRKTCDDVEERARRRVYRGCLRSSTCEGCTSCVCTSGCATCRFSDCGCQTCIEFMRNANA